MKDELKVNVSKYVSYLLRHNPEDLEMNEDGFVDLKALVSKVRRRYPVVDRDFLVSTVKESERKRFEIVDEKIRALYGHSVPVHVQLEEDRLVTWLYHGTTPHAAEEILNKGLKPMKRKLVHLSPTMEVALEVGRRRTAKPIVLMIDVSAARNDGVRFSKVTDKVYVSDYVPARFIKKPHV